MIENGFWKHIDAFIFVLLIFRRKRAIDVVDQGDRIHLCSWDYDVAKHWVQRVDLLISIVGLVHTSRPAVLRNVQTRGERTRSVGRVHYDIPIFLTHMSPHSEVGNQHIACRFVYDCGQKFCRFLDFRSSRQICSVDSENPFRWRLVPSFGT